MRLYHTVAGAASAAPLALCYRSIEDAQGAQDALLPKHRWSESAQADFVQLLPQLQLPVRVTLTHLTGENYNGQWSLRI